MTEPGPAQLELIRRYARTLRQMHADAVRAKGPRIGAGDRTASASTPLIDAAAGLAAEARAAASDVLPDRRTPAAPA